MTLGERIMLTLVIVLVILFALALFGWVGGKWDDDDGYAHGAVVVPEKYRQRMVDLDKGALDTAYIQHVSHLWETWMRDYSSHPDPIRITKGLENSRQAYVYALERIEEREKQK